MGFRAVDVMEERGPRGDGYWGGAALGEGGGDVGKGAGFGEGGDECVAHGLEGVKGVFGGGDEDYGDLVGAGGSGGVVVVTRGRLIGGGGLLRGFYEAYVHVQIPGFVEAG